MSGETVLVVEDNDRNMKLVRDVLTHAGFTVVTASSAELGIELAHEVVPSLVLMDLQLPGMDGWSALRELRRSPTTQAIPVVAVTAFAMDQDRQRALSAGFDAYVTKPISVHELPVLVESFLSRERHSS